MDKAFLLMGSLAAVFMYFSSLLHEEPYYDLPIIGDRVYAFYFFLGYLIHKYREKLKGREPLLLGVFLGSTALNLALTAWKSSAQGEHYERFLEYGCPLVIMAGGAFFAFMILLGGGNIRLKERTKSAVDAWCASSFGIYLIHILFLDTYKKYVDPGQISAWTAVPGLTAGILILSFVCIHFIRKLPFGKVHCIKNSQENFATGGRSCYSMVGKFFQYIVKLRPERASIGQTMYQSGGVYMKLNQLLERLEYEVVQGSDEAEITTFINDSRKVGAGNVCSSASAAQSLTVMIMSEKWRKKALPQSIVEQEVEAPEGLTVIRVENYPLCACPDVSGIFWLSGGKAEDYRYYRDKGKDHHDLYDKIYPGRGRT